MRRLLIAAVPGLSARHAPWERLRQELQQPGVFSDANVEWLYFNHKINLFSRVGLEEVARTFEAELLQKWLASGGFHEIVLIGHSLGALIARKAWLNAVDPSQGDDYTGNAWGAKVSRFVLFAGLSRGIDTEKKLYRRLESRLVEALPGRFTIEDCYRGSAFITNLRISWIRHLAKLPLDAQPITVQLLGPKDGIVTGADSIDLDAFPNTNHTYVPGAGHGDVHNLDQAVDPNARLKIFLEAFRRERPLMSSLLPEYENSRVLMIVHGIRASNIDDWVKNAKEFANQRWPDVVAKSPTYLYLSALRFALPSVRKRYARFFRDFYSDEIAKHRKAQVSVLCHSNGTYSLGHCLTNFQSISVDRVCLAGSVLPTKYGWTELIKKKRVSAVRNDCATNDVPVAILCKALRAIGMKDVGTGGFDGFFGSNVQEVRYHSGGHDAMLSDANLISMLEFLLDNRSAQTPVPLKPDARRMRLWSNATPALAFCFILALAIGLVYCTIQFGWYVAVGFLIVLAIVLFVLDIY
ncbi:hypothetical protein [Bradyrhizobium liaoningense]